jgi:curved DNA-binding protein CbpA
MNHYETLGVDKTATPEQIKRAYRNKAKTAHPDKGGTDFAPVAKAYEVLKDPERRLLYDTTGKEREDPIEVSVRQLLLQLFNQALAVDDDIPVVRTVTEQIKQGKAKLPEAIKQLKAKQKRLEAKRGKITSKGETNIAHLIIDGELNSIAGQIAQFEREIKVGKACLEALKSYSEEWEAPKPTIDIYSSMMQDELVQRMRQRSDAFFYGGPR